MNNYLLFNFTINYEVRLIATKYYFIAKLYLFEHHINLIKFVF